MAIRSVIARQNDLIRPEEVSLVPNLSPCHFSLLLLSPLLSNGWGNLKRLCHWWKQLTYWDSISSSSVAPVMSCLEKTVLPRSTLTLAFRRQRIHTEIQHCLASQQQQGWGLSVIHNQQAIDKAGKACFSGFANSFIWSILPSPGEDDILENWSQMHGSVMKS